jgi:AcrR family transcriptional regulator
LLLDIQGVVGFRLRDLAKALGVTIPNLYRYFDNRDDLIYSALESDYITMCREDLGGIRELENNLSSLDDLKASLRLSSGFGDNSAVQRRRVTRLQALATIHQHTPSPELLTLVSDINDALESLFARAQRQDLVTTKHNARTLALAARMYLASQPESEFMPGMNEEEFENVLELLIGAIAA